MLTYLLFNTKLITLSDPTCHKTYIRTLYIMFLCKIFTKIWHFQIFRFGRRPFRIFAIFRTTRKFSLALYLKSISFIMASYMPIFVVLPHNPQIVFFPTHICSTKNKLTLLLPNCLLLFFSSFEAGIAIAISSFN